MPYNKEIHDEMELYIRDMITVKNRCPKIYLDIMLECGETGDYEEAQAIKDILGELQIAM